MHSKHSVCQVQFDAENFVNDELQKREDNCRRFVSLRDYDMQIVDVSPIMFLIKFNIFLFAIQSKLQLKKRFAQQSFVI